jgi:serine/threonine protein kinase
LDPNARSFGRFQILSRIAQGGMGALYRAYDPMLDREVAIKVLRTDYDNQELRQRFAREAQSAARLRHPNIVTIFDVGEQDGKPFMAMEFIQGVTLAEIARQAASTPIARKLELMDELAAALAYAHKRGIVHRDIKPANVMVDADGTLKVLDFGIARIAESGLTQSGVMMGTLNYMSPEQLAGGAVDQRSDIFAVGAVYYELLSGRQAFSGGIDTGVLNRIINGATDDLRTLCPGLDAAIIDIVEHCLQPDPRRRYQDLTTTRRDIASVRRQIESSDETVDDVVVSDSDETVGAVPTPSPVRTPIRSVASRTDIERRRREQIESHLDEARRQIDAGMFHEAMAAGEQALLLDPDNATAINLLERAREALDRRQAEEWVRDASDQLARGATAAAEELVNRALELVPGLPAAQELRDVVAKVRQERARERELQERIRGALSRATDAMDRADFQFALNAAQEALALAPDSAEAKRLVAAATEALAIEESRRRVRAAIESAQQLFRTDQYDEALAVLDRFTPADDTIIRARADLKRQIDAARQAQEQRRRADAERRRREALEAGIRDIRARLSAGVPEDALVKLTALESSLNAAAELRDLRREVESAITVRRAADQQREAAERARLAAERAQAERDRLREQEARSLGQETAIIDRSIPVPAPPPPAPPLSTPPLPAPPLRAPRPVAEEEPPAGPPPPIGITAPARIPRWAVPAGAGLVVVAIIAAVLYRASTTDTTQPTTSVVSVTTTIGAATTVTPTTVAPVTSAATTSAAVTTSVAPTTSAGPAANGRLASIKTASRQLLARRNLQGALASVNEGLRIDPNDAELRQILVDVRREARNQASIARNGAARARSAPTFAAGEKSFNDAEALARGNRSDEAVRLYLTAASQFTRAAAETPDSIVASVSTTMPRIPVSVASTSVPASAPATTTVTVPAATTSAAAATTTVPQQDSRTAATAAINRALDACEAAWASMKADNMAACGQTLGNSGRQRARRGGFTSQTLRITNRRIVDLTQASATVACQLTFQDVSERLGTLRPASSQGTITLRFRNGSWAVEDYEIAR